MKYGVKTNPEWCYLLGEFGVRVCGEETVLTNMLSLVGFGDYGFQGFPFYGGNFTYEMEVQIPENGEYILAVDKFRSPLLKISADGIDVGRIAWSPYQIELGFWEKGKHWLEVTAYGNRANSFGSLHKCD